MKNMGIAFLDISTGEFFVAEGDRNMLISCLQTLNLLKLFFSEITKRFFKETFGAKFYTYTLDDWIFDEAYARENLLKHFETHSLKGFGIEGSARRYYCSRCSLALSKRYRTSQSSAYYFYSAD